jgi:hypothetical protein
VSPFKRHGSQTSKPGPHRSTLRETVGQAKVSSQYSRHRLIAYALFLVCASASLEPALAEPLSQWIPRNVDAISIYVWSGADDRAVPNYAAIDRLKMTKDVEEKVLSMLERSAQVTQRDFAQRHCHELQTLRARYR